MNSSGVYCLLLFSSCNPGRLVLYALPAQDPDAGPPMVGDACTKVSSISVPSQTVYWTCGIAVKGDYACGGGMPTFLTSAHQIRPTPRCVLSGGTTEQPFVQLCMDLVSSVYIVLWCMTAKWHKSASTEIWLCSAYDATLMLCRWLGWAPKCQQHSLRNSAEWPDHDVDPVILS